MGSVRPEARVPRIHQGKLTRCCSFFPQGVIPDDPRGQQGRSDAFEENHQGTRKRNGDQTQCRWCVCVCVCVCVCELEWGAQGMSVSPHSCSPGLWEWHVDILGHGLDSIAMEHVQCGIFCERRCQPREKARPCQSVEALLWGGPWPWP